MEVCNRNKGKWYELRMNMEQISLRKDRNILLHRSGWYEGIERKGIDKENGKGIENFSFSTCFC